jgi:membrane-bound ClpP family serine protease
MPILDFINDISWVQALLLVIGLILVVFEMFHPGFGAPGIVGGVLLFLGIVLTAKSVFEAGIMIVVILAILGIALTFVLQSATKGRLSRILILNEEQKKEDGYTGTEDMEYFIGKEGVVMTILRPSGIADFDGVKLDVVSESEFIPKDTRVKIIKVQGRRIVVKEIKDDI